MSAERAGGAVVETAGRRYFGVFELFLIASVLLHISLAFALARVPKPEKPRPPVRISIAPPPAPPKPPSPAVTPPKPTPPKPKPKPKRRRVVRKRRPPPTPRPAPAPKPEPEPEPEAPPAPPTPPAPPAPPAPPRPPPPPGPTLADKKAALARYLGRVRREVKKKRRYPRAARRLGTEGTVRVRLRIRADGSLIDAQPLGGGNPLLIKAAMQAVRAAAPFPQIPKILGQATTTVIIPLRFSLRDL